ncbi:hypothetical protein MS3_00000620 [Schistosoma haematobium]|uniref:Uncharacterized protein n=1 Tax=Schistosoma haematobium TaxID=6185 RepID=A0A922IM37_SCHHA|nr:hypothetical protein MS3_00000620 [Schistosoma haematobium]KAH9581642.1 hypothetical protein MS3_00000620 [Schistosoma haematobium]
MKTGVREGNIRQLCGVMKKLIGKYSKPERPVKGKQSKPIIVIKKVEEHFQELLNRPVSLNPPDIEAAHTDLPIDVNSPTIREIRMAIRQINSGKAAGTDGIPAEAQKSDRGNYKHDSRFV